MNKQRGQNQTTHSNDSSLQQESNSNCHLSCTFQNPTPMGTNYRKYDSLEDVWDRHENKLCVYGL
jgi:hypothetical protein